MKKKEKKDVLYRDFEKISVLVVDDNETNRVNLQKMLHAWGFQVKQAASGREALSFLRKPDNHCNVVLLDHHYLMLNIELLGNYTVVMLLVGAMSLIGMENFQCLGMRGIQLQQDYETG